MAAGRLRVAGGTARGVPLTELRGKRLRPTSALVREAIFNLVGAGVEGGSVLDLYAGTGALGIEALSRGAASAVFIESDRDACQAIVASLARTGFAAAGKVIRGRLPGALDHLAGEKFDVVLIDPPYQEPVSEELVERLPRLMAEGALLVYEHTSRYNPPESLGGLRQLSRSAYGDSAVALYSAEEP